MRRLNRALVDPADSIDAGENVKNVGKKREKEERADQREKLFPFFLSHCSHNQVTDTLYGPFNEILNTGGNEFLLARPKVREDGYYNDSYPGAKQGVGDGKSISKRSEYYVRRDVKTLKSPEHAVSSLFAAPCPVCLYVSPVPSPLSSLLKEAG
jgi:hypothetical protein